MLRGYLMQSERQLQIERAAYADLVRQVKALGEENAALKSRGIPTALIRFEGEYHGTGSKPSNFMRTQLYMMSWYNKYRRTGNAVTTVMDNN